MLATQSAENYLGGVDSADIHIRPDVPRAHLGSGIYATDRRLIIIRSMRGLSIVIPVAGAAIAGLAAGLPTGYSPKTIEWLDSQQKEFEASKESISAIVMTTRKGPLGAKLYWLEITLQSGQSLPIMMRGQKVFSSLVNLMVAFCADRVVVDGVRVAAIPSVPQTGAGSSPPIPQRPPTIPSVDSLPPHSPPPPVAPPVAAALRPTPPPPPPAAPPVAPFCTYCGRPTNYIAQYGRYYCYPCTRYV